MDWLKKIFYKPAKEIPRPNALLEGFCDIGVGEIVKKLVRLDIHDRTSEIISQGNRYILNPNLNKNIYNKTINVKDLEKFPGVILGSLQKNGKFSRLRSIIVGDKIFVEEGIELDDLYTKHLALLYQEYLTITGNSLLMKGLCEAYQKQIEN